MNRSLKNNTMQGSFNQTRQLQSHVENVEKHFGLICQSFGSLTRKTARLRDKGDILVKNLVDYSDIENASSSTQRSVRNFAENLAAIQDFRQIEVQRLESNVVGPLSQYGHICKQIKNDLKNEQVTKQKETKQRQQLERTRAQGPQNRATMGEVELQRTAAEATVSSNSIKEKMNRFEANKIRDLKKVLRDFVQIELSFHANALEYYSKCYQDVMCIDEEEDLENFRSIFSSTDSVIHDGAPVVASSDLRPSSTHRSASYPGASASTTRQGRPTNDLPKTGMYHGVIDSETDDDDEEFYRTR